MSRCTIFTFDSGNFSRLPNQDDDFGDGDDDDDDDDGFLILRRPVIHTSLLSNKNHNNDCNDDCNDNCNDDYNNISNNNNNMMMMIPFCFIISSPILSDNKSILIPFILVLVFCNNNS